MLGLWRRWKAARTFMRLAERLERAHTTLAGTSMNVVVQSELSWQAARARARENGVPEPERGIGCEVNVWDDVSVPAKAHRAETLVEALELALNERK